jgi:hypothetical protein
MAAVGTPAFGSDPVIPPDFAAERLALQFVKFLETRQLGVVPSFAARDFTWRDLEGKTRHDPKSFVQWFSDRVISLKAPESPRDSTTITRATTILVYVPVEMVVRGDKPMRSARSFDKTTSREMLRLTYRRDFDHPAYPRLISFEIMLGP